MIEVLNGCGLSSVLAILLPFCNSLPLQSSSSFFPSFLGVISLPDFLRLYHCWGASILLQRGQFIPTGGNENTNLTVDSSQTPSRSAVLMSSPVCRDSSAAVQPCRSQSMPSSIPYNRVQNPINSRGCSNSDGGTGNVSVRKLPHRPRINFYMPVWNYAKLQRALSAHVVEHGGA